MDQSIRQVLNQRYIEKTKAERVQQCCKECKQERGGWTLMLPSQRPKIKAEQPHNKGTKAEVSGTSKLRSSAILTNE
jgi:hypothetical protein